MCACLCVRVGACEFVCVCAYILQQRDQDEALHTLYFLSAYVSGFF